MEKDKENGFTLIELLAVIVILAVIALIATPLIMNVIDDAKKGSAKDSAYAIIKAGELKVAREKLTAPITFTEVDNLEYKGTKAEKLSLEFDTKGRSDLQLFIGGTCIYKDYDDKEVRIDKNKTTADTCVTGVRSNVVVDLEDGIIPVTYDASGNTVTADTNEEWYNYSDKKWANAVSVKSASRSKYTSAGTQIEKDDILGYFVYIPRYRYQLWNAENGVSNEQEIKIEFERRYSKKSNGTKNGEWLTHPAFTFGNTELNGIWVGKFELTGTATVPTTKPNSYSLTGLNISSFFNTVKLFQTNSEYGLSGYDAHVIKNMEWGSVSYLSHSKYGTCNNGTCSIPWLNNVNTGIGLNGGESDWRPSITGCSGDSVAADVKNNMTACEEGRDYKQAGVKASTTGNIYGVYDMSGGVGERMMSSVVNENGTFVDGGGGFKVVPDKKYWESYEYNTDVYNFNISKLGDGIREIRKLTTGTRQSWYTNFSRVPISITPWFSRGGGYITTGRGDGMFYVDYTPGGGGWNAGTRAILVKE